MVLEIDGTLVDSNYQHTIAWYCALHTHGHTVSLWQIHRHIGMGGDQIVAALVAELSEEGAAEVVESIGELRQDLGVLERLAG